MFHDLDQTLRALLASELPGVTSNNPVIEFTSPAAGLGAQRTAPTINLFLFDLSHHRDLRTGAGERREDPASGRVREAPADLRVDASYLITTWSPDATSSGAPGNAAADEHRLLGEVLVALNRYPVLPEAILQGAMVDQPRPIRARLLQGPKPELVGDSWRTFAGSLKPSILYTLTLTVVSDAAATEAERPRIRDLELTRA